LQNILTIDLEEWYHAEYVKNKVHRNKEDFARMGLSKTLDLLREQGVKATFFVLGEIAERYPELIPQIEANGHEVAFHAFYHEPLWKKTAETFKLEINKFNAVAGKPCKGFRAPSFSLNNKTKWALNVLNEAGFMYDSSIFPAKTPLYGVWDAPIRPYKPSLDDVSVEDENTALWEFPPLVYPFAFFRLPTAGGFYLRFLPLDIIRKSIEKANKRGYPAVIFVHSWEVSPEAPRLKLGLYRSFVTYHNIEETSTRLKHLLSSFEFTSIEDYMKEKGMA